SSLNITEAITLSAWIRPAVRQTKSIVNKSTLNGYEINTTSSGRIEFWLNWDAHGLTYHLLSNGSYPSNGSTWMHVAATFDGQTMKIYLNGIEDNSLTAATPTAILNNNGVLTIGSWGEGLRFQGALDEIRIYNQALSASQINQVFNNQQPVNLRLAVDPDEEESSLEDPVMKNRREGKSRLYPNPVDNQLNIQFDKMVQGALNVTIYDVAGRIGYQAEVEVDGSNLMIDLSNQGLSSGVYSILLRTPEKIEWLRFLKK
ncbi:LamG-like jellyroll fold domain-containing protein, partial [Negadavirga shengliensis]